jgi:uncharacterized protein YkwD
MARAQAQGVWATVFAEEISVSETTAAGVVRALVVDATSPSHQHRQDLLSPTLRLAGVGCAPHKTAGVIYVVDLTNPPMAR